MKTQLIASVSYLELLKPDGYIRFKHRYHTFYISVDSPYYKSIENLPQEVDDQQKMFAKVLSLSLHECDDLRIKEDIYQALKIEEYLLHHPPLVVDKYSTYELLMVDFGTYLVPKVGYIFDRSLRSVLSSIPPGSTVRHIHPFLKMVNPSTGEIHIESVGRDIKTVKEALKFRAPEWAQKRFARGWFAPKVLT